LCRDRERIVFGWLVCWLLAASAAASLAVRRKAASSSAMRSQEGAFYLHHVRIVSDSSTLIEVLEIFAKLDERISRVVPAVAHPLLPGMQFQM